MEARIIEADKLSMEQLPGYKTIVMPAVQSMTNYIERHWKRKIINALNRATADGYLDAAFGFDVSDRRFTVSTCKFRDMDFWYIDMYTALIDVKMIVRIDIGNAGIVSNIYGEIWVDAKNGFDIRFGRFGSIESMPERELIRMSTYLVPYLDKKALEELTDRMLEEHDCLDMKAGALRRARLLASAMGLKITALPLYKKNSTESILYFRESDVLVQENTGTKDEPRIEKVEANTIVLNTNALHKDQCAMPIFHECVHYRLHFLFYRLQQMYNDNDVQKIGRKKIVVKEDRVPKNPLRWMEWQAKRGAYALMMPYDFIKPEVSQRLANCCVSFHQGSRMDVVGRGIAKNFDIPKFRVRARMIQIGYIHAYGALNYVDGKYIEPFDFCAENYDHHHTFVIDSAGIAEVYENDEHFRERLDSGYYVYADGHIVINDPQYVKQGWDGLRLTAAANAHVDLCCLRFTHFYETDDVEDYDEFYYGALHSDEEYNHHYFGYVDDGTLSETEQFEEMDKLIESMPTNFNRALRFLMDWRGKTEEELAEAAGVSVNTIDRRCNEKEMVYKAEQIVPICLALHLSPMISYYLLELAGIRLSLQIKQHRGYRVILDCHYMDSMENIQQRLRAMGMKQFKNSYMTK